MLAFWFAADDQLSSVTGAIVPGPLGCVSALRSRAGRTAAVADRDTGPVLGGGVVPAPLSPSPGACRVPSSSSVSDGLGTVLA